jgi:hypothetical protein
MIDATLLAVFLGIIVGVSHSLVTRRNRNKYRNEWEMKYGIYQDPVSTVWLARNQDHDERQRKLDASQNVMTRLL